MPTKAFSKKASKKIGSASTFPMPPKAFELDRLKVKFPELHQHLEIIRTELEMAMMRGDHTAFLRIRNELEMLKGHTDHVLQSATSKLLERLLERLPPASPYGKW